MPDKPDTRQLERELAEARDALDWIAKEARMMNYDWDYRSSGPKALQRLENKARAVLADLGSHDAR